MTFERSKAASGLTPDVQAYIDSVAAGLTHPKASARVATTANITLSGTQTIDGVSVIAGDRVLVKNQTTGSQNGVYVCAAGAWSRSTDADTTAEVSAGMYLFVEEGSASADTGWVLSTNNPITLGTTALTFVKFSSLGGDVVGPASSTDNGLPRFDGTGGKTLQTSGVTLSDADNLLFPNTVGSGLEFHNQADTTVNYERLRLLRSSNIFTFLVDKGGTGTDRAVAMVSGAGSRSTLTVDPSGFLSFAGSVSGAASATLAVSNTLNPYASTSLVQKGIELTGTVNQTSGTGGYDAIKANLTLTAVGSAGANLLRLQTSSVDRLRVSSTGDLIQSSSATGGQLLYNTADETTNFERGRLSWDTNRLVLGVETGGTGSSREVRIRTAGSSGLITVGPSNVDLGAAGGATLLNGAVTVSNKTEFSSTSGVQSILYLSGTVNQTSGTGGFNALHINPTLTAVGSAGAQLIRAQVGGADRFRVDSGGTVSARVATAPAAGGTLFMAVSSSAVGWYAGSGAPTISAAKGSFYMRTDGSGTNDRMYVNTDGSTTWTAVVTVA